MPLFSRNGSPPTRSFFGRQSKALTAAAEASSQQPEQLRRLASAWQVQALQRYDDTGELWNPSQYFARAMKRIRYFPAVRDEKGVAKESTDPKLIDLFNRIRVPGGAPGDLSELAAAYARLHFVIGDGLLVVSQEDGEEVWEYLSPVEMRAQPNVGGGARQEYRRIRAPGLTHEQLTEAPDNEFEELRGDDVRVWRLWNRHPTYSQWADSPVRPVLDLYALLNRLTLAVYAEATSRAAQRGMLIVPAELNFGPVDQTQGENPEEDPLMRELQTSMSRAIANPQSAEAMSPFLLRVPGVTASAGGNIPTADLIKWIPLGPTDRYVEGEMWEKTISRLAGSLDLPKEMMTGIEDVSHWSAWFLDEVGYRQHTGPKVLQFCDDVAAAYLRPAAIADSIENADRVTIGNDPSEAINHPDETGVAADAHKALVVNDAFYRKKIGASDEDAPKGEELERRMAIQLRRFPSEMDREPEDDGETAPQDGGRGGDVDEGPPSGTTERPAGNRPPSPGMSMDSMIVGAALMQIDRARHVAGDRLRRRLQSCAECQPIVLATPRSLLAATIGQEQVRDSLNGYATEASLVDGSANGFAERLRMWGVKGDWPDQLGELVEQHALRTLYEPEVHDLPPGLKSAIRRALA